MSLFAFEGEIERYERIMNSNNMPDKTLEEKFEQKCNQEMGWVGSLFMSQGDTKAKDIIMPTEELLSATKNILALYSNHIAQQRQEAADAAHNAPMGVSQWLAHGKKYGYDLFFIEKARQEAADEVRDAVKKRRKREFEEGLCDEHKTYMEGCEGCNARAEDITQTVSFNSGLDAAEKTATQVAEDINNEPETKEVCKNCGLQPKLEAMCACEKPIDKETQIRIDMEWEKNKHKFMSNPEPDNQE